MNELLEKIKERLKSSRSPVILTGAGISAESGVPTFRGPGGLWRDFKPEELATPTAFEKDPRLVWEWYDWRRSIIAGIKPNPAHYALAELEGRCSNFTLITQNVDGLHRLAGSKKVLELHGSIWRVRCIECAKLSENRDVPIKILPLCECGGILRPDVVWFGEMLDENILNQAFEASKRADFMLVVGTSGIVQPAASLASTGRRAGAFMVEINPEPTPLSGIMDARFTEKAGDVLPMLIR
ncbi:MAG: NAD-dependent deacylase [Deltaproteobacteria bacterium]|nr:NAD-dependent deacylase [Deltaproteobacteria bacterium]